MDDFIIIENNNDIKSKAFTFEITKEQINALLNGKLLLSNINDEYDFIIEIADDWYISIMSDIY